MSRIVDYVKELHRDRSLRAKIAERGEDVHVLRQMLGGRPGEAYQSSRLARVVSERLEGNPPVRDLSGNIQPNASSMPQASIGTAASVPLAQSKKDSMKLGSGGWR